MTSQVYFRIEKVVNSNPVGFKFTMNPTAIFRMDVPLIQ